MIYIKSFKNYEEFKALFGVVEHGLLFNEAQKSQDRVVRSYSLTPRSSLQEAFVSIS